jgi:hypothetical protein
MAKGITRADPAERPQCGTNSGYYLHFRAGETTCDACRAAHVAYQADLNAACQRAHARLSHEYHDRYRKLYVEELALRGIRRDPGGH